jgi:hypothetical protein
VDLGRFFSFLIYTQSVGLLGQEISPSQGRYLHKTTQTQNKRTHTSTPRVGFEAQNKRTQTSMPQVGFESTIPVFERAKTVRALDRAVTVLGTVTHKPAHKYQFQLCNASRDFSIPDTPADKHRPENLKR